VRLSGEAFVSNAHVGDRYMIRACIVNFRTTLPDVAAVPKLVVRLGKLLDRELRPKTLLSPR
jgi:aromatic-L-amino-acid/L-tryptophan decarboxylase